MGIIDRVTKPQKMKIPCKIMNICCLKIKNKKITEEGRALQSTLIPC